MKRIHFVGVIALAIGLSAGIAGSFINVADAAPGWEWTGTATPQVVSDTIVSQVPPPCAGTVETVVVAGVGPTSACVRAAGSATGMRFGWYGGTMIISFAGEAEFYQFVTGFAADHTDYAGAFDTLLVQYDQYPGGGLLAYPHIKEHLQQVMNNGVVSYTLNETPLHPLVQSATRTWYTDGQAISANGRYEALELMADGFGVLDTKTMIVKRISSHGYVYGMGSNPTVQLAVSNDGSLVVVMGTHAGFKVIRNDDDCGDYAMYDHPPAAAPTTAECPDASAQFLSLLPAGLVEVSWPHFSDDDEQLNFVFRDHRDTHLLTIDAANYHRAPLEYLALGDSFTSGEGETDNAFYEPGTDDPHEKCHVSTRSYPFLLAHTLDLDMPAVKSVACSGATMSDIIGNDESYWGQSKRLGSNGENLSNTARQVVQATALNDFSPGKVHQQSFVARYTPILVTLGIGGNDAGLFSKLQACVMPDSCEWVSPDGRAEFEQEIRALFPKLVATYSKLRQASPKSIIGVVEYPQVINPDGHCDASLALLLNHDERQLIAESIHYLNQMIRAAAASAGVSVFDTEQSFAGQELCGADGQLAMNAIRIGDDFAPIPQLKSIITLGNETFHPTPYGHQVEDALLGDSDVMYGCSATTCSPDLAVTAPMPDSDYWPVVASNMQTAPQAISSDFLSESIVSSPKQPVHVATDTHVFAPGSSVAVTVHSTEQTLATLVANNNGDIATNVSVPADLEPGYHTIHLKGVSFSGEAIDMYQTFLYEPADQPAESTLSPVIAPIIDQGTMITKGLSAVIAALTGNDPTATRENATGLTDTVGNTTSNIRGGGETWASEAVKGASVVEKQVHTAMKWWPFITITVVGLGLMAVSIWWIVRDPRRR